MILAQQFLEGPEYAIDSVSRNGEHKVTAVWRYDKVGFVYQCTRLVPVDGATRPIINALFEALDAAGHANGPAHSELIVVGVPTLVEINARFHNANVRPLVDRCVAGPNAIALAAAACVPDSEGVGGDRVYTNDGGGRAAVPHFLYAERYFEWHRRRRPIHSRKSTDFGGHGGLREF